MTWLFFLSLSEFTLKAVFCLWQDAVFDQSACEIESWVTPKKAWPTQSSWSFLTDVINQ